MRLLLELNVNEANSVLEVVKGFSVEETQIPQPAVMPEQMLHHHSTTTAPNPTNYAVAEQTWQQHSAHPVPTGYLVPEQHIHQTAPVQSAPAYQQPTYQPPVQQPPMQQPPVQSAPVQQPPVQTAPVYQTPPPVPTMEQTYTTDQLAVAATQLMDAGKRNELVSLLSTFGVDALTQLPKEHYGAFATSLRGMGAKI